MLIDTATSLVEFAREAQLTREAQPLYEASQVAAMGLSLKHIQQARHQRVADLCFTTCLAAPSRLVAVAVQWQCSGTHQSLLCTRRLLNRRRSAHPTVIFWEALMGRILQSLHLAMAASTTRSVLADFAMVVCRAPAEVWGMSVPEACLLLGRYVPATAQLFAEFRRLRDGLSPAEARAFAKCTRRKLQHEEMMFAVRLCACPMPRPGACRAAELKSAAPQVLHLRHEDVQDV